MEEGFLTIPFVVGKLELFRHGIVNENIQRRC